MTLRGQSGAVALLIERGGDRVCVPRLIAIDAAQFRLPFAPPRDEWKPTIPGYSGPIGPGLLKWPPEGK